MLRRFLARVTNFAMGQRSREFGIRVAAGATRGDVMGVVFHQGLVLSDLSVDDLCAGCLQLSEIWSSARNAIRTRLLVMPAEVFCRSHSRLGYAIPKQSSGRTSH